MRPDLAVLPPEGLIAGRYALFDEIGAGGMASVHLARLYGSGGFTRTVAIKRLHAHFVKDPDFTSMFMDEAWLASRVRHPNVVPTLDVVRSGAELLLVMEYVPGETLLRVLRIVNALGERIPPPIAVAIMIDVLHGLSSAHEALGENGEPLRIVHRDVSPQNILVGADGIARMLDFGIAKAVGRLHTTQEGVIRGKAAYMSPEQVRGLDVDSRADTYAAAVTLWEVLAGERLFVAETPVGIMNRVLEDEVPPPSVIASRECTEGPADFPAELDAVVLRGLARDLEARFPTAMAMASALAGALAPATRAEVRAWLRATAAESLDARAALVAAVDRGEARPIAAATEPAPSQAPVIAARRAGHRRVSLSALVALVSLLAVPLAAGVVVLARSRGRADTRQAEPASPLLAVTSASSTLSTLASASASVTPPETPSASASTPPTTASTSKRPPAKTRNPAPVRASGSADCDPPYRLDAAGIRRPKPECL